MRSATRVAKGSARAASDASCYQKRMVSEANTGTDAIRPLRRAEYEILAAGGVFGDEKLELLRGALVPR